MSETLRLRPLAPTDETVLRRFHEQLRADDFEFLQAEGTWDDIIATHEREARGIDLPPGRVRADFLVAEVAGRPVGRTSIRYEFNDFLFDLGGHVGYAVAPGIPSPRLRLTDPVTLGRSSAIGRNHERARHVR
jgi:predicted acetyltransferase